MEELTIQGDKIRVNTDLVDINELKFLVDNPRVYSCIHGIAGFENLPEESQQKKIFDALKEESSVKNLRPDIKRNGGLMENILVRWDRKEVIEGNSRLAVYKLLHEKYPSEDWELIPCDIVRSLTEDQQAAFLNQIHVKGKTHWTAYENANFAYVRYERGRDRPNIVKEIADLFGETEREINTRITIIEMMKENGDAKQSHFSYYDVLTRNRAISKGIEDHADLKSRLLEDIKCDSLDGDAFDKDYAAQEMRNKLPVILKKGKILKQFISGEISMDEAYQRSKISNVQERIRKATKTLEDVSAKDIKGLERNEYNSLKQDIRKLNREMRRIGNIVQSRDTATGQSG